MSQSQQSWRERLREKFGPAIDADGELCLDGTLEELESFISEELKALNSRLNQECEKRMKEEVERARQEDHINLKSWAVGLRNSLRFRTEKEIRLADDLIASFIRKLEQK